MKPGDQNADNVRMGLAFGATVEAVILVGRSCSDQDKRNLALAVAMGVMHGCCGPNGDFSNDYRPRDAALEGKDG